MKESDLEKYNGGLLNEAMGEDLEDSLRIHI